LTRVGKKGVSALQDNFYILFFSSSVNNQDDEVYMSDDEGINRTTRADTVKYRLVFRFAHNKVKRVEALSCFLKIYVFLYYFTAVIVSSPPSLHPSLL
jgi:hypothetical protein